MNGICRSVIILCCIFCIASFRRHLARTSCLLTYGKYTLPTLSPEVEQHKKSQKKNKESVRNILPFTKHCENYFKKSMPKFYKGNIFPNSSVKKPHPHFQEMKLIQFLEVYLDAVYTVCFDSKIIHILLSKFSFHHCHRSIF